MRTKFPWPSLRTGGTARCSRAAPSQPLARHVRAELPLVVGAPAVVGDQHLTRRFRRMAAPSRAGLRGSRKSCFPPSADAAVEPEECAHDLTRRYGHLLNAL